MKPIRLTRHARNRMRWHEISEELIEQTVRLPEWEESSVGDREGRPVKIEYDPEADALYIQIREVRADDNIDIEDGVTVDVDEHKHIVGVEILDASKRLSASDLSSIIIQKLPLEMTNP